ncbi:TetR/AcrR family transcriptional regulator [Nocardiopsis sp. MG754419]|uniref:TetR/AcrR family transcriptional regulator n=1 Tax=Nocardiopsis sp. MG754419 TaxID=2259865 RepID=UPI001BA7F400|nr:TetR/AcrR family transcriptional regulator [Nocardiopsis sp. MG754419]MBR8742596.1 TetR/AcrR family transcriptional regulator [Nocardiopsis sp. MG754419]
MPRKADPARRREVLDSVIDQLARTGVTGFTLRGLAQGLGRSTRVLTHHFADREALVTAVLERLDERQHHALRDTEGWEDPAIPVGDIVRAAWRRTLDDERAMTRLIREIEGLAAADRLPASGVGFVRGRAEFVASCLVLRGAPSDGALRSATLLNAGFSGLQTDLLVTGDRERVEAALDDLCAWIDARVPVRT